MNQSTAHEMDKRFISWIEGKDKKVRYDIKKRAWVSFDGETFGEKRYDFLILNDEIENQESVS